VTKETRPMNMDTCAQCYIIVILCSTYRPHSEHTRLFRSSMHAI